MVLHSAFSEMDTSSVQFIFVLKGYCESQKESGGVIWDLMVLQVDEMTDTTVVTQTEAPLRGPETCMVPLLLVTLAVAVVCWTGQTPPTHIYHLGHDIACGLPVTCSICCWQNFKVAVSVTELTLCVAMRESRCWVAAVVCNIHRFLCKFKLK